MSIILKNLSSASITEAIEDNFYDFMIKLGSEAKKIVHIGKNIKWVITKPSIWPNYIFDAQFDRSNVEESIKYLVKKIEVGNAPSELIVGPKSKPTDLLKHLKKYGFKLIEQDLGMAINLLNINYDSHNPCNFNISVVDDKKTFKSWIKVASLNFFSDNLLEINLFKNLLFKKNTCFYIATLGRKIVGTSLLYISSGVAGVYFVSTIADYRSRGIGALLTVAPLLKAKNIGYFVGVLLATQLGRRVYKKIGFEEYCKFYVLKLV